MTAPDFSVRDVLQWARTKPADEQYFYIDSNMCALAQYGMATGRPELVGLKSQEVRAFGNKFADALIDEETFGALVTRLEKLCPDQVIPPSEWTRVDAYMTEDRVSA